jgi:exonuclease SbcC
VRILSVQLSNIKSYAHQAVRFEAGTNCICGENGAGKTTIVEAIGWALFDFLPYNQKQFRRDGTTAGQVAVTFLARDGREYEVVRKTGGAAPNWYVFDQEINARLAEGSADVKEWLQRQLGTEDAAAPQVLFQNAVGVPQGGLTAPFLQSTENRKHAFDPILRVHEYSAAASNLLETNRHLENQARDQRELAATHGVEADKIPLIARSMQAAHDAAATAGGQLKEREKEKQREDAQVAALESEERRITDLRNGVGLIRQSVAGLRESYDQATARVDQAWRAHEAVERSTVGHKLYVDAQAKLNELQPRHEEYLRLSARLLSHERDLERASGELESSEREIARAETASARLPELGARAEEAVELGKRVHALERTAEQLPGLEADLRSLAGQIRRDEAEAQQVRAEIGRIEALRPDAERTPELRERRDELALRIRSAQQAGEQAAKLGRDGATVQARIKRGEARVADLVARSKPDPKIEELAASLGQLERRERETSERRQELGAQYRELKARKAAEVVACPLSRADCLALQRAHAQEDKLGREMKQIEALGKEVARELEQAQAAVAQARLAVTAIQEVQVVRAQLDPEQRALEDLRNQQADLHAELALQQELAAQLPALKQEAAALAGELGRAEAAHRDVGRLADLGATLRRLAETLEERARARARLETQTEQLQGQLGELQGFKHRLAELGSAAAEYADARGLANRLPDLRTAREGHVRARQEAQERIASLRRELAPLEGVEAAVRETQRARDAHRAMYEAYLGNISMAEELPRRQIEQKQVERELSRQTAQLEQQEAALRRSLERWDERALHEARGRSERLSGEIGALAATIRSETARLDELSAELDKAEQHAALREAALAEAERLQGLQEVLAYARKTLKEAQAPVTEALLYGVSQEARSIFSDIVDDHSARLQWTPEYEVQLERGSERLVFNQMSGGEQMSAALAVRLALLKTLSDIDIAFLDEPTQNMDETRRSNLAAQVREVKGFEQLFVISHDDTFERQVSHAVVVRKVGGDSVVAYGHEEGP